MAALVEYYFSAGTVREFAYKSRAKINYKKYSHFDKVDLHIVELRFLTNQKNYNRSLR